MHGNSFQISILGDSKITFQPKFVRDNIPTQNADIDSWVAIPNSDIESLVLKFRIVVGRCNPKIYFGNGFSKKIADLYMAHGILAFFLGERFQPNFSTRIPRRNSCCLV